MKNFMNWIQNVLMPPLAKVGNNKYLVAVRNGLVMTLPAVISGSVFLIIGNIPIPAWTAFMKPYMSAISVAVNGSFGIISLLSAIGIGYELAKNLDLDAINGAGLSTMAFVIVSFNDKNVLDTANFASSGLFTAIVCAFVSVLILNFFVKRNLVIKLPDGVPTAVNHSFVSLVPGFVILLLFWTVRVPLHFDINVFIQDIFHPLLFAMNSLPGIMFYTLLVSLLWVGGIHGDMTLEGIADPIFLQFLTANATAWSHHQAIPYFTSTGFSSLFVNVGGTGATIMLVFWMLSSKSKTYRELGKVAFPSALFEINEPVIFGFPVVMNPITLIPFVVLPQILVVGTYALMALHLLRPAVTMVPWTMPPIIGPLMATGWDWRAGVWSAVELVIAAAAYYPFFKVAEKQMVEKETLSDAKAN
ncbi:PTS sugar transporter subunit IIC [Pediococcus ethanolidurans]|uniref:PTS sugar transporter subunit IIC n=1 Tax=Pediococcus ethanolidurans TaxID=319653 RepID=UPI002956EA1E|nr:PTS sugar transporter subunit IIC [Pediococcus ethanolidurans]